MEPQTSSEPARQSRALSRLAYVFMGLFALAVCLGAAYSSWRERAAILDTQLQRAQASALVMEEEITLTLKLFENTLRALAESTKLSATSMTPDALDALLGSLVRNQPMLRSLSILDDDQVVYASSNIGNRGKQVKLNDFLPAENPKFGSGHLRMGNAWTGRDLSDGSPLSGNDALPSDRPFFVPVVIHLGAFPNKLSFVAAVNPDHFLNRFSRQTTASFRESFRWIRLDGKTLAFSAEHPQSATFGPPSLLNRILQEEIGYAHTDGLVAFRTSGLYPFFVAVDSSSGEALAAWMQSAIGLATGVLLALSLVTWVTLLLLQKIEEEEQKLHAERIRLQAVYDILPVGISITDPQGEIIDCNPASERLLGITKAELLAHDYDEQSWLVFREDGTPMPREEFVSVRALKEQQAIYDSVVRVTKATGDVWLSVSALPVAHKQYGVVIAFSDITEQRLQAQALLAAKQQAESASQYKSQFLANMSHEIRTPMNAILGMLKLLHHTPLQTRQLDYVEKTESAAKSLLSLINDILDFSKVEAGKLTLDPQPFEVRSMLADLAVILSANLENKSLEILVDVDPAVPERLIGDVIRLQQILINLGGNAIKFTPTGEVTLRIALLEHRASHIRLGFELSDTGIGIAPENQLKIFSDFTQAEASTTRRFGGTGLGLAICRRLVELMGGELQLVSALGQGSSFSFSLPFYVPPSTRTQGKAAPSKVLLLESHPRARALTERLLSGLHHAVYSTDNGEQAREWMAQHHERGHPFDVIIIGGVFELAPPWKLVAELRRLQSQRSGPAAKREQIVLCVTSAGREAAFQQSRELQSLVDGYLLKPLTQGPLEDLLQQLKNNPDGAPAVATQNTTQRLAGLRVLVVEDNAINQQVAEELLTAQGATVDLADNGEHGVEAVAAAEKNRRPYDAVLMDMQMPVMDGLAATATIRQTLGLSQLPVIAMTANALVSDRQSCLDAGMNDHIGKPFDLENLVAKLLQWARPHEMQATRQAQIQTDLAVLNETEPQRGQALALINLAAALQRLGGNQNLLRRMLQRFSEDLPGLMTQCANAHAQHATEELAKLLHTVKGTASALGAEVLAHVCAEAEKIARTANLPDLAELRATVASTLEAAQTHTAALSSDAPPSAHQDGGSVPVLTPKNKADLKNLCLLLRAQDMAVFEALDRLTDLPAVLLNSQRWNKMVRAVDSMDFAGAAGECESLLEA
ncbi:MAG: hypothetical protein RL323_1206 [Pseudomonadota bacterium]|jgi:PAS domain S-box-containing protein